MSRRIVRNLDQPIEVAVFFPEGSEVREEVDNYMQDLARESGQLKLTHYDFDIDPLKAKEYGISSNGVIVFVRGPRHEQLGLPREIESAKNALRTLDKEVQQRLMMMVKPPRTVAFTQGHGERNWEKPANDTDKRPGIKTFRDVLVDQNYDVRYLGAADGLMQDVPKDVTVVMVIGPQKPFLPEESAALNRFIDRGGRLLIALDPENHVDMPEVLKPLDLEYHDVMLANDQAFARRTHQDNDRTNLVTVTYSSHPSVTTLQRLGVRAPIILPGAGWINANRDRQERRDRRLADQGAPRDVRRQERQLPGRTPARIAAPGRSPPPRSRRTPACSCWPTPTSSTTRRCRSPPTSCWPSTSRTG